MNLGQLLKVGGATVQGYGEDKRQMLAEHLAQVQAQRQANKDAIDAAIAQRTLRTPVLGDPNYAKAQGDVAGAEASARVPAAVAQATALKPLEVEKAAEIAGATAPVQQATHRANKEYDNANPAPVQPSYSFPVVTDANGKQVVGVGNTKTGEIKPSETLAKATGSAAKLTGDQEKSYLFYNLMKNAEPEITAGLASGKIRPAAISAYLAAGSIGDIPVIGKAVGALASPLANSNLNEDEQKMIRAGKDFTAGVKRKESGQAVSNAEIMETMERYFPGMFGDKPGLTDAKTLARQQYMQTMEQEAGPAIQYYGRQKAANPPAVVGSGHEGLSDEEFKKQWAAGKRSWP